MSPKLFKIITSAKAPKDLVPHPWQLLQQLLQQPLQDLQPGFQKIKRVTCVLQRNEISEFQIPFVFSLIQVYVSEYHIVF